MMRSGQLFLLVLFFIASCGEKPKKESSFSTKITVNDTSGYGYEIYNNNKLYIRQPIIPAVEGNKAFSARSDAQKTADYIVNKLENGITPPTVSVQ
jgi:hypothetical protein